MIKVWDLVNEEYLSGFKAHNGFVTKMILKNNSNLLLSAGGDGKIKV